MRDSDLAWERTAPGIDLGAHPLLARPADGEADDGYGSVFRG